MKNSVKVINLKLNFFTKYFDITIYVLIGFWLILRFFEYSTNIFSQLPSYYFFQLKLTKFLSIFFVVYYLVKWVENSRSRFNFVFCLAFIFLSYYLNKYAKTQLVFDLFFIPLFLCRYLNRDKFYLSVLISICVFFVINLALNYFGALQNPQVFVRNGTEAVRYNFGLVHPNLLGFIAFLFCLYYSLKKKKIKLFDYVLFVIFAFLCYKVPNSITSSCLLLLLLICCFVANFLTKMSLNNNQNKLLLLFLIAVVLLILFTTYYITFTASFKNVLQNMPGAIWARFELSKVGYDMFGFSLFGKFIEYYTIAVAEMKKYNVREWWVILDCSYFYLPIIHGLIVYAIYLGMVFTSLIRGILKKEYFYALLIVVIVIYGVSETVIFRAVMMPFFAYTFFLPKTQNREDDAL